jgi:hypothetical protein
MGSGWKLGWGVLGVAAALVLAAIGLHPRAKPGPVESLRAGPSTTVDNRAELAAVGRDLSLMRAELAGLKERVYQAPLPASAREEQITEPPPSAPEPVTLDAAQVHFDQVFQQEVLDSSWARAEEASIGEFVKREGGDGSSLENVTCRSSMCRMQLRFSDDRSRDAFKLKLGTPPLNNGGFYREQGETGLVYFAARAGHPLATVPAE